MSEAQSMKPLASGLKDLCDCAISAQPENTIFPAVILLEIWQGITARNACRKHFHAVSCIQEINIRSWRERRRWTESMCWPYWQCTEQIFPSFNFNPLTAACRWSLTPWKRQRLRKQRNTLSKPDQDESVVICRESNSYIMHLPHVVTWRIQNACLLGSINSYLVKKTALMDKLHLAWIFYFINLFIIFFTVSNCLILVRVMVEWNKFWNPPAMVYVISVHHRPHTHS